MYCAGCGAKLPDDVKFCPKCGTVVSQEWKTKPHSEEDRAANEAEGTTKGWCGDMPERDTGAHASESDKASGQDDSTEQDSSEHEGQEIYEPPVDVDDLHTLDRNGTLLALSEAEKIALHVETFTNRINADLLPNIQDLENKISAEMRKADQIRDALSPEGKRTRRIVTVVGLVVGIIIGIVVPLANFLGGGILFTLIAFIAVSIYLAATDTKKHKEEKDAKATAYIQEHIPRLERELQYRIAELEEAQEKLKSYIDSGAVDWAEAVVGVDLFYSSAISDLRQLVESHRADNLKEALLQYDEMQHKARMEEMQAATKAAAESTAASAAATAAATAVSAAEAVKQTELERKIARNTRRTATAAAFTAVSAHNTSRHTKDIENDLH